MVIGEDLSSRRSSSVHSLLSNFGPIYQCIRWIRLPGLDEADLWWAATGSENGSRAELPFVSIGAEMWRGFRDCGEAMAEIASTMPSVVEIASTMPSAIPVGGSGSGTAGGADRYGADRYGATESSVETSVKNTVESYPAGATSGHDGDGTAIRPPPTLNAAVTRGEVVAVAKRMTDVLSPLLQVECIG
jgi:hypothetical protein